MYVYRLLALVLVTIFLWPVSLHAQSDDPARSDELRVAMLNGEFLVMDGKPEEAIPFLQTAVELSEKEFGADHEKTASARFILARAYTEVGRFAEAEPLYRQSLPVVERKLGPENLKLKFAKQLVFYATALRETGHEAEAEEMEDRAKAIRAKHAEENP